MTYHYNITKYRSLKDTRLWTDRIFLSTMILTTIAILYYNSSAFNILFALPLIVITSIIMLMNSRQKVLFVDITDGTLSFLDTGKGEMVSVPIHDITHISTKFCQLNVHTLESTHSLNLGLIRNEKTRWEIKEMIRKIARQAPEYRNHPKVVA